MKMIMNRRIRPTLSTFIIFLSAIIDKSFIVQASLNQDGHTLSTPDNQNTNIRRGAPEIIHKLLKDGSFSSSSSFQYFLGKSHRTLTIERPEDVGHAHYTIIDNLQRSLKENIKDVTSYDDFLENLGYEIEQHVCYQQDYLNNEKEEYIDDNECQTFVYRELLRSRSLVQKIMSFDLNENDLLLDSILPDNFDPYVKESILNTFATLSLVDDQRQHSTIQPIMNTIDSELQELISNTNVSNELHRNIGVAAISVTMESMKQWIEIRQDPDHIFFQILPKLRPNDNNNKNPKRNLEEKESGIEYIIEHEKGRRSIPDVLMRAGVMGKVIRADAVGSILGAVNKFFSGCPLKFIQGAISVGVTSSVVGAMVGTGENFIGDGSGGYDGFGGFGGYYGGDSNDVAESSIRDDDDSTSLYSGFYADDFKEKSSVSEESEESEDTEQVPDESATEDVVETQFESIIGGNDDRQDIAGNVIDGRDDDRGPWDDDDSFFGSGLTNAEAFWNGLR